MVKPPSMQKDSLKNPTLQNPVLKNSFPLASFLPLSNKNRSLSFQIFLPQVALDDFHRHLLVPLRPMRRVHKKISSGRD